MKLQIQLWRLFASDVHCRCLGAAPFRLAYGGGLFPAACMIMAVSLIVAGVGVLFRRASESLMWLLALILKWLSL